MAGLDATGLTIKTQAELQAEIEIEQRATISPALNLSSATVLGQVNGIFSAKLAELWELGRAVDNAFNPDGSGGASLKKLAAITGTLAQDAMASTAAAVTCNLDDGFSAAAGDMVASVAGDPTRRFVNSAAVANSSGVTADIDVDFMAETVGPVEALAGQLTVIAEPLTGWNSVTNPTDATPGLAADTDSTLRVRRRNELAGGSHTVDAIRTDIAQNTALGVLFCAVIENDTDAVDANGIPAKALEVIVYGPASPTSGDDQALADQIRKSKPAGILAYGGTLKTSVDEQGNTVAIRFTRAAKILIYLEVDIRINSSAFPADGDAQVKAAMAALGDAYAPGDDAIAERIKATAFSVAGVVDVIALRIGLTASPVSTSNIAIDVRELADIDTSRILVTHV